MPRIRIEPIPPRRLCRTCGEVNESATEFYAPRGVTPRLDCKLCENAIRYANRQAAMATDEGRERRREQWRQDQRRARARKLMDPAKLAAIDARAKQAKEDAKRRREAFARFRLADALREEQYKVAQGQAYVPRGMRAPWAVNSKRRRALGKSLLQLEAESTRKMHESQPEERWQAKDYFDIEIVRLRHKAIK